MYARFPPTPARSVLLFGPRGTGKSTWIRMRFPDAPTYDLLNTAESLRLNRYPGALFEELEHLPSGSWAVVDEVQKAPALLDEVHRLIETRGLHFVLSGSSARKLRRGGVNLLAGRATTVSMFPLVSRELAFDVDVDRMLRFGMLPTAVMEADPRDYLRTYAETYLDQEIRAEALTRNVGGFARFLEVAARQNGQATNTASIARDAGVARGTVRNHFDILTDTLIGYWLPAWKLKSANRQVSRSKFYLFDCGVARALSGRVAYPLTAEERGSLLETLVLGEMRAYLAYSGLRFPLHFWRNYHGTEVDVLCETAHGFVGVEIKAAGRWERRFNRGLHTVRTDLGADRTECHGIYTGDREAVVDGVLVHPVLRFLKRMWDGEIFG